MAYWVYVSDDGSYTAYDEDSVLLVEDAVAMYKKANYHNYCNRSDSFVDDYTVLDIETTGFSRTYDDIIEIACLKVRNNISVDEFSMLVKPVKRDSISDRIVKLTGITNEMLNNDGIDIEKALMSFMEFVKDDVIIGHNVNFDIGFLTNKINSYLDNDFKVSYNDTLKLSRKKYPHFSSHKLNFLSQALNLSNQSTHRALKDCYATLELYNLCKDNSAEYIETTHSSTIEIDYNYNYSFISESSNDCDDEINIKGKHFCFTGTLINMQRNKAIEECKRLGAFSDNSITKNTNYLVMGIQDYALFADGKESSKTKKAEELIKSGQELQIIDENYFLKMISVKE